MHDGGVLHRAPAHLVGRDAVQVRRRAPAPCRRARRPRHPRRRGARESRRARSPPSPIVAARSSQNAAARWYRSRTDSPPAGRASGSTTRPAVQAGHRRADRGRRGALEHAESTAPAAGRRRRRAARARPRRRRRSAGRGAGRWRRSRGSGGRGTARRRRTPGAAPRSVSSAWSLCPCARPATFQVDSPCRTSQRAGAVSRASAQGRWQRGAWFHARQPGQPTVKER